MDDFGPDVIFGVELGEDCRRLWFLCRAVRGQGREDCQFGSGCLWVFCAQLYADGVRRLFNE